MMKQVAILLISTLVLLLHLLSVEAGVVVSKFTRNPMVEMLGPPEVEVYSMVSHTHLTKSDLLITQNAFR